MSRPKGAKNKPKTDKPVNDKVVLSQPDTTEQYQCHNCGNVSPNKTDFCSACGAGLRWK